MPATAVTTTTCNRNVTNGVDLTAAGAAADATNGNSFQNDGTNGNSFQNDGTTLLRVKNTNAATRDVTVFFQGTLTPSLDGVSLTGAAAGKVYTIPATTGDRIIGPFPTAIYGTTVHVDYSADTGVTVFVYQPAN